MPENSVVLVTGAAEGLGYHTVRQLAVGSTIVIAHARSGDEAAQTRERLLGSGVDERRLHLAVADFTELRQVADMANAIAAACPRIDVLVNNAGTAGAGGRTVTADGHEQVFQVNYLAPYLLTRLLEDALAASPVSRVVNVSSSLHRGGRINWNDLNFKRRYHRGAAYAQSKLALTMFTTALTERCPKVREAVSVHPGILATGMLAHYSFRGRPVTDGAEVVARLADPGTRVFNGGYYDGRLPAKASSTAVDPDAVERLWRISEKLTFPEKRRARVENELRTGV
ncbi:SDR family NAD(P)-dependent oxidoreductase [Amycolatopsis sp. WGS_07]|uniref:SDR family NAD(P)-dependent oxidoreductase n=1 Tax=Amycolatopsis sp. WGS_07 TaxID=3076764 RepID=UPI00387340F6